MRHVRLEEMRSGEFGRTALTIGNFDGVHRGHQQVLRRLKLAAKKEDLPATVITFEPHPVQVLYPGKGLQMIHTYKQRADLLARYGVENLVTVEFTKEVAATTAEQWVVEVMIEKLRVETLIMGYDFSFGRGGDGDAKHLIQLGRKYGFSVEQVPALVIDGRPISSSRIRRLIAAGEMALVMNLLGRPFHVTGEVIKGDGRGRQLGIPTANIDHEAAMLPHVGIYGGVVVTDGEYCPAAINVGCNPTFDQTRLHIEAHILDFEGDLYGKNIEVHFLRRLRDERKYQSADQLVAAIKKDIDNARQLFHGQSAKDWLT